MPWYKAGTVSVVQNSNAVIGTNSAFIANSRVGDGFRGPDGGWYEVTNIASDTAMSIDPPYKGTTNNAGGYALAPLQGYVKDSADALRSIVNQYGAKLASLGTTGNYDILPVSKGGTAGTDQASARTGLGLGTAATRNAGTAPGQLMLVGSGGLLGLNTPAISSTGTVPGFSSQYYASGTQYVAFDGAINQHFTNRYDDGVNAVIGIIAIGGGGENGTEPKVGVKLAKMTPGTVNSTGSTVWRYLYHTGNTTRAADGTLKAI